MSEMKRRPSLLKKIWRKVLRPRPAPTPAKRPAGRPVHSSVESLEGRISPAALISPTMLKYKDFDGDIVTVTFSKPLFTDKPLSDNLANANTVFQFNTGTVDSTTFNAATAPMQQLLLVDLTKVELNSNIDSLALNTAITVTAVKSGGDGVADVGYIKSTNIPLGAVSISGDLGQIDSGKAGTTTGLASLKVKSLGVRNAAETQPVAGRSLVSNIAGTLGSLTVTGDVNTASVLVTSGKIGPVTIGGSLKGGAADDSGEISATGDIGPVKIGTLPTDGIKGGTGGKSGRIESDGKIASLTVSGDIAGSTGIGSATVQAGGTLGPVMVKGSIAGGAGQDSGAISAAGIGAVTVGGSLKSGGDSGTGVVFSTKGIGAVKISGDIDGTVGTTVDSIGVAGLRAYGKIASVTVLGSIKGGTQAQSGFIDTLDDLGPVAVNAIVGGAGQNSGAITGAGKITSVSVKLDVTGGGGYGSGSIFSGTNGAVVGDMGPVKIGGKLTGGTGDSSGAVISGGKLGTVTIGPAVPNPGVFLKGGGGSFSGAIVSHGLMGAVKVSGQVEGGNGTFSGSIASFDLMLPSFESAGDISSVTITGHLKGGAGADSGAIHADGNLTTVTTGDVLGDGGARSGSIRAGEGSVHPGVMGVVTVKGMLNGGAGSQAGYVVSQGKIGSVLVTGSSTNGSIRSGETIGSVTFNSDITTVGVVALGQALQGPTTDLAIGRITVLGDATTSRFRAGYDTNLNPLNPDAQIGSVYVKGNWSAGDILAGVIDGGAAGFGTAGDVKIPGTDNSKIVSQIASIIIGGNVSGTDGAGDHFGFTAQKIVALKVGKVVIPFTAAADQNFDVAADVSGREVPI